MKVERAFNHNVNRILNDINGYELEDSMSLAFVAASNFFLEKKSLLIEQLFSLLRDGCARIENVEKLFTDNNFHVPDDLHRLVKVT